MVLRPYRDGPRFLREDTLFDEIRSHSANPRSSSSPVERASTAVTASGSVATRRKPLSPRKTRASGWFHLPSSRSAFR